MSSPPSPPSSFGDSLLCPVCFIMFEGRIIQCSQGHSVCEKCHRQLNNECPQCRSQFVGTRNYLLEDIVKQLTLLKKTCANSSSDAENGNSELKAIAKFVASIPKPSETTDTPIPSDGLDSSGDTMDNITVILPPAVFISPPVVATNNPPAGLYHCRMTSNCKQKLPICRMLNHIRCFHKDKLMETRLPNNDPEFVMHWTFPCASYRHAIQIAPFGLFFFIVNIKKEPQKTTAKAWVQCVCPNADARKYTFHLELRMGNQIGSFTDYVYGNSSDEAYIEEQKQCLHLEVNRKAKQLKEIAVDIKIGKTTRPTNIRRANTTTTSALAL